MRFCSVCPAKRRDGMLKGMFVPEILLSLLAAIRVFFRSRSDTALEVLALRQQVAVLKRKRPRPKLNRLGPTLLNDTPPMLVPLAGRPGPGETRHRGRLASRRLPSLLALAIPAARRPTEDYRGDSRSDPTLSAREPGLGSAEDPRRAVEARVRCL